MIDTDKYKAQLEDDNTDTWVVWRIAKESLAEVKRLREVIDKEHPTFDWASRQTIANLEAEVKRLRDELDKQMEYIEWLEQFAPKAGEYNTSWEAYELAKEAD